MKLKDLRAVIVTHEYFKGSGQEFRDYFINNKIKRLFYIAHPFFYAKDTKSYLDHYEKGKKVRHWGSISLPKIEFLLYIRDFVYTFAYILITPYKFDLYVGVDSFNALAGIVLKKLGKVDTVVFFTIDYVMHERFPWKFLNDIYVKMDRWAFFGADYTWNVSDRMSRQRVIEIGDKAKEKTQLVVPIGVPHDDAKKVADVKRKDNILVYSGGLTPQFGLELMVEAMPNLLKKFPDLELRIIGEGVIGDKLRKMVSDLDIEDSVNFVGFINTSTERKRWLTLLKESTFGLATYEDNETTYKRFSDVTKPKDYMSVGLPIITTSVIPLSEDVKEYNLGRVVEYNVESFVKNISELLNSKSERHKIEKNVAVYCKDMTWDNILNRVLSEMDIEV